MKKYKEFIAEGKAEKGGNIHTSKSFKVRTKMMVAAAKDYEKILNNFISYVEANEKTFGKDKKKLKVWKNNLDEAFKDIDFAIDELETMANNTLEIYK